jgi:hypothetical protein
MALNSYEMKLHEYRAIDANNSVLRVPGGWAYNNTFVPWDNEFQTEKAPEINGRREAACHHYRSLGRFGKPG